MMKEYAYDTKLPAAYKGGNIRILDRHYGVGSRDELTKWDEHPWSTAAYIIEGFPVCGVDPGRWRIDFGVSQLWAGSFQGDAPSLNGSGDATYAYVQSWWWF